VLARLFAVPDGQGGKVGRLVALMFVSSLALVVLKAAQSGIFLATHPSSAIPPVFAASAVVLATLSSGQVALLPRTGPLKLAVATLLAGAAVLLGLFSLLLTGADWVTFVLYVVVEALSGLLIIQLWTVTSGALDPRSAKQVLPLCGVASSCAWTLGGLVTGPIGHALGASSLLVIGAVCLAVAAIIVTVVARRDYDDAMTTRRRRTGLLEGWLSGLSFVRRVPLMRILATLSVLALLTEQLMDVALMTAAQARYAEPEALSAFFGRFYGLTSLLSTVVLLTLSPRILQSVGASRALLAMPAAVVVFGAAAAASSAFVAVVVLRGGARVLKQALWGTSLEQTQTPLPVARRSQAKALIRGVLAPGAYALLAGALSVLPDASSPAPLAGAAAVCGLALVLAILRTVRRAYVGALHHALDQRRLDLDQAPTRSGEALDADALAALAEELASDDPGRASLAVDVLADRRPPGVLDALVGAAAHAEPQVRRAAVLGLAKLEDEAAADAIADRLLDEPDVAVQRTAARALRALPWGERARAAVTAAATADDAQLRAIARVARFERESPEDVALLLRLLGDAQTRNIALTAVTPAHAGERAVQERLRTLLDEDEPTTRAAALRCVRRLRLLPLLPDAVRLLEDPRCAQVAATEIASWGPEALDILARISKFTDGESEGSFYRMARARWAERAYPVLVRLLAHREPDVRRGAGRVLCGLVGVGDPDPLLRLEVERIFHSYGALAGLAWGDGVPDWRIEGPFVALASELELHIAHARDRLLQLLYLLDSDRIVRAVEVGLRRPTPRLAAQVAELLELSLEPHLARRIVPLFDRLSLKERVEAARKLGALDERALTDPLGAIIDLGDPHLRRTAMLVYKEQFAERFPDTWAQDEPLLATYDRMRFLRSVPLFGSLVGDDLRSVAEIVEPVDLTAGDTVFEEGDPGDNLFLILEGEVRIEHGGRHIATLTERDVLGELAVLDKEPRSADAVAATDTRLLRLRAVDLEELIARRPQIQAAFVQVLVRRLRSTLDEQAEPDDDGA
jgi:AAA family ATP:ADP antiporter